MHALKKGKLIPVHTTDDNGRTHVSLRTVCPRGLEGAPNKQCVVCDAKFKECELAYLIGGEENR